MTLAARQTVSLSPIVQDKIDNIIRRLESGERLIKGSLRRGDNFCVLGLFADESGLGKWAGTTYIIYNPKLYMRNALGGDLTNFYKLSTDFGLFLRKDLPPEIQLKISESPILRNDSAPIWDLSYVNDRMLGNGEIPNEILAGIIRSGVIFRKSPL